MAATLEQRRRQRFEFLRSLYQMSRGSERVLFYVEEIGAAVGLAEADAHTAAHYLAEKGLIRVVMRNIIAISQGGIDELEAALEQPEQPTPHFPPAQGVISKPEAPQSSPTSSAPEKPSVSSLEEASLKPLPDHIVQNDSDELAATELMRICEAIGLDPKEITGELAPHHDHPIPDPAHKQNPAANSSSPQLHPDSRSPFFFKAGDLDVILESLIEQLPKLGLALDALAEAQAEIDTARAQLASPKPKPHILAAALRTLLSIFENAAPPLTSDTRQNLVAIRDFQQRLSA